MGKGIVIIQCFNRRVPTCDPPTNKPWDVALKDAYESGESLFDE